MKLEKIKREFVKYMEVVRAADPYPKKFFGCLISILIEPEPTSQERIMEMTGYSQGTVSLTLQKIQLIMPLKTIKMRGERKHYYEYDSPPERFILDLWQKRVEAQAIDILQIKQMLEKVRKKATKNPALKRLGTYLENMKQYLNLVHELRTHGIEQFEKVLEAGSFDSVNLQNAKLLEKGVLADFLENLRLESIETDVGHTFKDEELREYLSLKNEYFTNIKVNLNPLYSQVVANQMLVLHDVFLDGYKTQEQIEESTLLPRSTISEILAQSVKRNIVKVTKKEGSRTKFYQPAISFVDLMLGNFDQLAKHISIVMPRLSEFISMTHKITPRSKKTRKFLEVLRNIKKAYSFTSKSMKVEMVIRLKEELDRGFVFF
ncbi:MAG: hypothetical protein ACXABZ_14085 [Candidatus Thorarchaeota archaeon]|jgi:DNA-binding transcriptional regulator GbsR (MarR family)